MRSRSPQAFLRQPQAAKLIVLVRIRAGQIEHALRPVRHHRRQRALELGRNVASCAPSGRPMSSDPRGFHIG